MDTTSLISSISVPRLSFYETFLGCATDQEKVGAYVAYQDLSGDFFCLVQMIEVALRNAKNNTINANHGPAWYDSIPQTKKSQDLVLNAKQKALDECGVRYTDDDVICRLTFGFWVYMLDAPYRDTQRPCYIWTPENKAKTFPHAKNPLGGGDMKVKALFDEFHKVLLFRNRLFHHEPIWKKHHCKSHSQAINNMLKEFNFLMNALSIVSNEKKELIEFIGHDRRFYERCTIEYVMGIIGRIKCRELKVAG